MDDIRSRVRERHGKTVPEIADFELPPLEPLGHARDRADNKTAAIGGVNPRPPGLINDALQGFKKLAARSLNWLVRDQIDFNRAAVAYMDRNIEAMIEQNHNILRVARELAITRESLARVETKLGEVADSQGDILKHWHQWRPEWEERITQNSVRSVHIIRELEAKRRASEESLRKDALAMHALFVDSLSETTVELQQRFWADLEKLQADNERLIHAELRVIRRRAADLPAAAAPPAATAQPAAAAPAVSAPGFDYARFEERFRGDEAFVRESLSFYLPYFKQARRVLDIGCGRGEFLELIAEQGAEARGVDLDADALAACREKGLNVAAADLFAYLADQPDESLDGVLCAHVVEHLPALRLPELVDLVWKKLRPGGVFALETPNPGCLAIFSGDFYLDPTHQKPVPAARLDFHLNEAGFGRIEKHERHPAVEAFPELAALDEDERLRPFRERFFGGLDYAIIGHRLKS